MHDDYLIENLLRYVGQTVTIFTTSGGISGSGFTGVLLGISYRTIKLITRFGSAPTSPLYHNKKRFVKNYTTEFVGSIAEIPVDKIVCFVHNAI